MACPEFCIDTLELRRCKLLVRRNNLWCSGILSAVLNVQVKRVIELGASSSVRPTSECLRGGGERGATRLSDGRRPCPDKLVAACSEMADLRRLVAEFVQSMVECRGSDLETGQRQFAKAQLRSSIRPARLDQGHTPAVVG